MESKDLRKDNLGEQLSIPSPLPGPPAPGGVNPLLPGGVEGARLRPLPAERAGGLGSGSREMHLVPDFLPNLHELTSAPSPHPHPRPHQTFCLGASLLHYRV